MVDTPVLITGGSGYVGRRLVRRLAADGIRLRLLLRATSDVSWLSGIRPAPEVLRGDLEDAASLTGVADGIRQVIHLVHIRYASAVVAMLSRDVEKVVFLSSLRALSQVPCPSVQQVLDGERLAQSIPGAVILRPSMIYGPGDDRNLSRLTRWLRRRSWLPVIGADCLHQPVYVDDVIDAIVAARRPSVEGVFAIAGPMSLAYHELIATVGEAVGVRPRLIPLPAAAIAGTIRLLQHLPRRQPMILGQVLRLLEDKSYDIDRARRLLDFQPRSLADGLRVAAQETTAA